MAYTIKQNLTNVNYNQRGTNPSWIVIHNTANGTSAEGTAYANTCYFKDYNRNASAHYFVDDGDVVWQCVRDTDSAWHVGDSASRNGCTNWNSIGIEVCERADGSFSDHEIEVLAWLVPMLMDEYGIDASHVCRHHDVTGKYCPMGYIDNVAWQDLKGRILSPQPVDAWPVQMYESNGTAAQKWVPHWNADYTVSLETLAVRGKYLDVVGGGKKDGTLLQIYPGNGTDSQKFIIQQIDSDIYKPSSVRPFELIPVLDTKKRIDVSGGSAANGAAVQIWTANGTAAQQWYILDNGDGTWTLLANLQGKKNVLDVVGGGR